MTDAELNEIEARANAATYGKWRHLKPQVGASTADGGRLFSSVWSGQFDIGGGMLARDAEFIAYAREDVPALVAEVKALQSRITDLHAMAESNTATIDRLLSEVKALRELADTQAAIIDTKNAEIAQMKGDYAGALVNDDEAGMMLAAGAGG